MWTWARQCGRLRRKLWFWRRRSRTGKSLKLGGNLGGLGGPDPLEDLQRLPQVVLGLSGIADRKGAPAQARQCVSLIPRAADAAGQFEGLLVAPFSLSELTADPVQCPSLVERLGLATPVTEVTINIQGLLQGLSRGQVITRRLPHDPEVAEGGGLAEPVAEVPEDAQGMLQGLGRGREITRRAPHLPEIGEGVGLAEPMPEVAEDAQGLLVGLGRGRVLAGSPPYAPEVAMGDGLAELVAKVAVDAQGLFQGLSRGQVITR
jgi:hypothetical protein